MIGPIKTIGIYVDDQQAALEFYTLKLGFELRRTMPMTPTANWLEIAPPGAETCLVLYPRAMMSNWEELRPSVVFHSDNVEATCEELTARGVTITMPPTEMGWGTFAKFVDLDGNEFGLTAQAIA